MVHERGEGRPDLFHAYIGAGQMVSESAPDRLINEDLLAYADRTGTAALAERMRGYGPPPYHDLNAYAFILGYYDAIGPYEKTGYFQTRGPSGIDGTGASEYGPLDKVNKEKALADTFSVMYPQLNDVDFALRSLAWTCPSTWSPAATSYARAACLPASGSTSYRRQASSGSPSRSPDTFRSSRSSRSSGRWCAWLSPRTVRRTKPVERPVE